MGWGRMLLLGNVGQQMDIGDVHRDLQGVRQQIQDLRRAGMSNSPLTAVDKQQSLQIRALQHENEQLQLCVFTLVRLLHAKSVVTREELETLAALIDKAP